MQKEIEIPDLLDDSNHEDDDPLHKEIKYKD